MYRLVSLLILIAAGCSQQAELRSVLTSGKWVKDLGSGGQSEHYVYTFDRDGTYTSKLLTDHTTPIVEGRWRLVEGADGKIHLQLSDQQGKDKYYWLSQDSVLSYDDQKDELVVSGGHYDGEQRLRHEMGAAARDGKAAKKESPELYEGFKADKALLRKQFVHKAGGKDTKASSGEACQAADRIFSRISFLNRTRDEVLELLGDPASISDYNQPAGTDPTSPLEYVFDTGLGGTKYTIRFGQSDRVRVTHVQVDSLD